jgi:cytochrome c oxidase subunit II
MKARTFLVFIFCMSVVFLTVGCAQNDASNANPLGNVKSFTLIAKNWEFTPSTITVQQGDTVELHVETIEGVHGIMLPEFKVNKRLNPGEKVTIRFVADKKGSFPFICSVYCGEGHDHMSGVLIVE